MRGRFKLLLGIGVLVGLIAANIGVANAHRWGSWHWHKSGSQIVIRQSHAGTTTALMEAARQDAWNKVGILYNYRSDTHTDVSVFDGNYGATGWAGLASIESYSGSHILHAHARYNKYYAYSNWYIQGIHCQEVFHTYGFDHDNTGGCMGLGYYSGQGNTLNSHNNTDFYNLYRYH